MCGEIRHVFYLILYRLPISILPDNAGGIGEDARRFENTDRFDDI